MNVFWICCFINQIYPLRTSRNSNFILLQTILILNRLLHEGYIKISDIYSRSEKNDFKLVKGIRKLYEKLRDILCTTILLICVGSDGKDDPSSQGSILYRDTRSITLSLSTAWIHSGAHDQYRCGEPYRYGARKKKSQPLSTTSSLLLHFDAFATMIVPRSAIIVLLTTIAKGLREELVQ